MFAPPGGGDGAEKNNAASTELNTNSALTGSRILCKPSVIFYLAFGFSSESKPCSALFTIPCSAAKVNLA